MKRVLCLFDYGENCMTGYATVSNNIVEQLKKHFGEKLLLDIVAINYYGEPYFEHNGTVSVISGKSNQHKTEGRKILEEGDDFGRLVFIDKLVRGDYDGIFILNDIGTIVHMIPYIRTAKLFKQKNNRKSFKSVIYFPIDGLIQTEVVNEQYEPEAINKLLENCPELIPLCKGFFSPVVRVLEEMKHIDTIVTYTEYARNEITKHCPELRPKLKVIYHGINTDDFFMLNATDRADFRKQYFGENAHKFIVGVINRNQYRKDIPTSIFGFIEAKKNWPENLPAPFLYLHMKPDDYLGWKLKTMLALTDLKEGQDYMFSVGDQNGQVELSTFNKICNSIDVFLSTALGGGWELTVTNEFACGVPCIIPNHTSMAEIGANGRAYLLEEFLPFCNHEDNVIRQMCHYEEVAEKIIEVVNNLHADPTNDGLNSWAKHADILTRSYQWISELTWEKICKRWIEIFDHL